MQEKSLKIRWLYLVCGVIAMLFAGVIYAWSILKIPLQDEFGWTASQLAINFTLTMCFFCLGGFLGSLAAKKVGTHAVICAGAVLAGLGFVLSSRLNGNSVVVLYIFYGVLAGLGIGSAYIVTISTVSAWFPDKKGLCSGCLMMGFGVSTLLLGNVVNLLMGTLGWRSTYLMFGCAIGTVVLVAGLIICLPSIDMVLPQPKAVKKTAGENFEMHDFTTPQMLKRFTFWRAFVCIVFLASVGNTVISFARDLALSIGASAPLATSLVGVLAVCNGLGRILTGALFDAAGRRITMLCAALVTIMSAGVTLLAVMLHSVVLCVAGLCLVGLAYGACPTLTSAFTSAFYGAKYFSTNFSVMNFNLMGASFMATAASALLTSYGSYKAPFILLLTLAMTALGLNLSIKKP